MLQILPDLPEEVVRPALTFPAFRPLLENATLTEAGLAAILKKFQ
jgi:hypothetical protein